MKYLILTLLIFFNSYNSLASENSMSMLMTIKFKDNRAQYKEPLKEVLLSTIKNSNSNTKFLVRVLYKDYQSENIAKNYVNGIVSEMMKQGIEKANIRVELKLTNSLIRNEIQIMAE